MTIRMQDHIHCKLCGNVIGMSSNDFKNKKYHKICHICIRDHRTKLNEILTDNFFGFFEKIVKWKAEEIREIEMGILEQVEKYTDMWLKQYD